MDLTFNNIEDRNGKIAAAIYTVLCLLLLFAFRFVPPQVFENEGVIINLGYTETGMTNNTPETVEATNPTNENEESSTEVENPIEESVTQDVEETITVAPETTNATDAEIVSENTAEAQPEVETDPQPTVNESALFTNNNNNPNEGTGNDPGDQGQEDGQLESDIYQGVNSGGAGNEGFGWSLSGRSLNSKPTINDNSQEKGTIVLKIKVDQSGNVVDAQFTSAGSTTTDSHLISKAMEALKTVKFNPSPNAPEIQQGTFTFEFKLQ